MITRDLYHRVAGYRTTSAWSKGVKEYALELLNAFIEEHGETQEATDEALVDLMQGAEDWTRFSVSGFTLITSEEIARRVCSVPDLRRFSYGREDPSPCKTWFDVQAEALRQAHGMILNAAHTRSICASGRPF